MKVSREVWRVWTRVSTRAWKWWRGEKDLSRDADACWWHIESLWGVNTAWEQCRREEKRLVKKGRKKERVYWREDRVQEQYWWNGKGPEGALMVQEDVAKHCWWQGRVWEDAGGVAKHCWWHVLRQAFQVSSVNQSISISTSVYRSGCMTGHDW